VTSLGLTPQDPVRRRLSALGIESIEQLIGAAGAAAPELEAYLSVNLDELIADMPQAMSIPFEAAQAIENATYTLGVALEAIEPADIAFAIPMVDDPAIVTCANLVSQMPPIRNQQARGSCVAYAALAAYEHRLAVSGAGRDLSEQFMYWNCKRSDGLPTSAGTWLGVAMPLLQRDGCCEEIVWPYVGTDIPGNEGQGPPPAGAQLAALALRPRTVRRIAPASVADYRAELALGHVVAFSIPVFNSWFGSRHVAYTGDITMPIPGEVRVGGHAMAIVGCLDEPKRPEIGGGRFILRNSWGPNWGISSPHGKGYGTIPYAYIARFGAEAYALT
jgi:hypothetical protein